METAIRSMGGNVERMESASPAIIFVPWPELEASARCLTLPEFLPVKNSVIKTIPTVTKIPTTSTKKILSWDVFGRLTLMTSNAPRSPRAAKTAVAPSPW